MKDRLEEFVAQNREAFDMHEPDPSLWLKINPGNEQKPKKDRRLKWISYAAAAAVFFAAISAGVYFVSGGDHSRALYGKLNKEMLEAEVYYTTLTSQKYNALQPYFTANPQMKDELDYDLNELDEIYDELKEDLKDNVGNTDVIDAMIQQYRMKVEILEDLLLQIKEKENQDYEKEDEYSL